MTAVTVLPDVDGDGDDDMELEDGWDSIVLQIFYYSLSLDQILHGLKSDRQNIVHTICDKTFARHCSVRVGTVDVGLTPTSPI